MSIDNPFLIIKHSEQVEDDQYRNAGLGEDEGKKGHNSRFSKFQILSLKYIERLGGCNREFRTH